ncbi:DUF3016 domain-containing protein [Thalassotalea sediminis]|uniref:DUF3016 domain-containing protein n=1 Tax=Thalassotalea sediminis TaxID=1759089 RepID=UPI0025730001|nr:DUF3016 domain-containing protein [Thalassotalea sediminis]
MYRKLILLCTTLLSYSAFAGNVQVFWENPENYTDIIAGTENKHTYQEEVFAAFEQHFIKLAKKLPDDKTLYVSVKDLDLAGAVTYVNSHRIRVVKEEMPPRIEFSFQLIDVDNKLLASRGVSLYTPNFKFTRSLKFNKPYYHDFELITDWFENTFKPIIEK